MPAWIAPATWVNGTLTAAFANAEVRDHLIWLKAALDLITNSTAADSGDATSLRINRSSTGLVALQSAVTGDAVARLAITAGGVVEFGDGTNPRDVVLYWGGANQLKTDDDFAVGTLLRIASSGAIVFSERTDPAAPAANTGILYVRDNGSGKSQLAVRFPSGAVQVIATEP